MNRILLIIGTIILMALSGVLLGNYYLTQLAGDSEYYLLFFSLVCAFIGIYAGWVVLKKS
jgi:hypothetical protein|tara:strand:- start:288 stop:467 length:180 start_codon:yes stop_codon:yes gene_type:complete